MRAVFFALCALLDGWMDGCLCYAAVPPPGKGGAEDRQTDRQAAIEQEKTKQNKIA